MNNERDDLWEDYEHKVNGYVKICREEQLRYEKDIIDKWEDHPKLFFTYVNGTLKQQKK